MKNLFKAIMLICIFSMFYANLFSQNYVPNYLQDPNQFLLENFEIQDYSGWFIAKPNSNLSPENFMLEHKNSFGLGSDDNFELVKESSDNLPFIKDVSVHEHYRLNQTYKGLTVEYAEVFIHAKNDKIKFLNAKLAENLNLTVLPTFPELEALEIATDYLGNNNTYAWQVEELENDLKVELEDENASYFPKGELILAKVGDDKDYSKQSFVLAWKFSIVSIEPYNNLDIYIDATNGTYLKQTTNTYNDGPASLLYYGTKTIDTDPCCVGKHHLYAKNGDRKIKTKEVTGNCHSCADKIKDSNDIWTSNNTRHTSAHYCATKSWDYFTEEFGRIGADGSAEKLRIWTNSSKTTSASFNREGGTDNIYIGDRNNFLATYDIIGHEFTHGVIRHTADLKYEKESGALNESFADIFGVMVERYSENNNINDWLIGEDASFAIRNFINPNSSPDGSPQPKFFGTTNDPFWFNVNGCDPETGFDKCGVHINSGVQNYFFYLLVEGSQSASGTLDNIVLNGIGADKASSLAYYVLTECLGKNSTYQDSRNAFVNAARMIFDADPTSPSGYFDCYGAEYIATNDAWAAVGIGEQLKLDINGTTNIQYYSSGNLDNSPVIYTVNGNSTNYDWNPPFLILNVNSSNAMPNYVVNNGLNSTFSINSISSINHIDQMVLSIESKNNFCSSTTFEIGFTCLDCLIFNEPDKDHHNINITPNPVNDYISLIASNDIFELINYDVESIVSIKDMQGNLVLQIKNETIELIENINVATLNTGIYLLKFENGNNLFMGKFVKN